MSLLPPLARQLKRLRKERGLNFWQLAQKIGVSHPSVVQKIENGETPYPRWNTMCALADALGVSLEVFRNGDEDREEMETPPLNGTSTLEAAEVSEEEKPADAWLTGFLAHLPRTED